MNKTEQKNETKKSQTTKKEGWAVVWRFIMDHTACDMSLCFWHCDMAEIVLKGLMWDDVIYFRLQNADAISQPEGGLCFKIEPQLIICVCTFLFSQQSIPGFSK